MTEYQDMVTRPHPDPKYHTRMPLENRAAQFALDVLFELLS